MIVPTLHTFHSISINIILLLFCLQLLVHSILTANLIPHADEPEIPWHSFSFADPNRNKKLDCKCGDSTIQSDEGNPPPWQVLVYTAKTDTPDTIPDKICSGTVINDRVILTAASCLMELPEMMENKLVDVSWFFRNKFEYFYGSIVVAILPSKKTLKKDISAQQILEVEQYDFNLFHAFQKLAFGKMDLDIVLLKLTNPLNFNDPTTKILPLCLPTQYLDKELIGFEAFSSGWKVYNELDATATPPVNNVVFEYFTMSSIKISPRAHCRTSVFPLLVSESFTCSRAAPLSEVYGINSGGAPVMISSKSSPSQFVMIGIHAWSSYMVFDAKPPTSLETNVSGFLKVIESFSEKAEARWCDSEPNDEYEESTEEPTYLLLPEELETEWKKVTSDSRKRFMLPESTCHCGLLNSETKARIQGGTDAKPYDYGFQVMIHFQTATGLSLCGGTVINDKTILTAAHCVRSIDKKSIIRELVPPGNFSVKIRRYAGTQYFDNSSVEVEVEYVVPHPLFKGKLSTGANYDVALLILKTRLDFNEHRMWVSPICLPETGETVGEAGREDALTLGFGRNDVFTAGKFPSVLQQLQIRILSKSKCSENWDKAIEAARIAFPKAKYSDAVLDLTNRVCAGTENNITNYQDALPGDSGGPLMVALMRNDTSTVKPGSETNPFIQVGVTSIVNFPILKALHTKSDPPTVVIYMSVQDMLPFIDYYSLAVEARWCARG